MKFSVLWRKWRTTIFSLVGIIFLAFFLRIYKLTSLPIFGDEAIYIRWAQVMRAEPTLRFVPLSDGKQPLFMWSVIAFLKIFSDPLFAGRLVSTLIGLGTIIGIFLLSFLLFNNKKVSLIASLVYAISPFCVFFDRMALVDSMLSFFGVWTLAFSIITVKKIRLDSAMIAGFFLGGALLTKSTGTFFALLIPFVLILYDWPKKAKAKFSAFCVFVFLFTFTYAIAFGMYNILRLGPNFQMISLRTKDYVYPLTHFLTSPFDPLKPFLMRVFEYLWLMGPSVLLLLILLGIYAGLKKIRKETLILLAWGFLPIIAVAEYSKTMTARYILFAFPYLVVLVGLGSVSMIFHTLKGASLQGVPRVFKVLKVLKFFFVIFILHAALIDYQLLTDIEAAPLPRSERSGYLEEWTAGVGIKEVADYIRREKENLPAGRQIVVGTEGYFGTLPDGLQIYLNDLPEVIVVGTGVNFKEIPESLIESKQAGNKTYFVVNSSRMIVDYKTLDLKLISEYPKALKPDGSRESLYLFKVAR